jgi:HEAT repeat protein
MVLLVDGALAAWDHEPARATWTSRAANATEPRPHRISALRALATVGHREAAATLATIALDRAADPALRLEAATAAGRLAAEELEDDARTMLDGDLDDRMVAVRLLGTHESKEAVVLLRRLGTDREPAVAYGALRRLVDIDPALIEDFVPALCVQPTLSETHGTGLANLRFVADDPKIRALAAEALVFQRTPDSINLLAPMLDDAHVDVRTYVRRQLVAHDAQPPLRAAIRRAVTRILHLDEVDHWQGVEQAALLLGAIDHEQVAPRLLKLMPAARAEVRVAANVALRRLAIPQTLDEVYQMAERICFGLSKKYPSSGTSPLEPLDEDKQAQLISDTNKNVSMVALDAQVSQMMQMFCLMDYRPAEPLMRRHIPKHSFGEAARAAAIWALGHFYADKADEQLGGLFVGRLSDLTPLDPELPKVRRFSAISIGRMKAAQCASALQGFYESESFSADIGGSCRWALTQIDGQQRPPLPTRLRTVTGFFIDPADKLERDEYLPAVKEPQ